MTNVICTAEYRYFSFISFISFTGFTGKAYFGMTAAGDM